MSREEIRRVFQGWVIDATGNAFLDTQNCILHILYVTNSIFSINVNWLNWLLVSHHSPSSSRVEWKNPCPSHDDFHCPEIVSFDLLI